jgi:hypothetical protein
MPIIEPDFGDLDSPMEPSTYKAKIIDVESRNSKAGNPGIIPTLEVQYGDKTKTRDVWVNITGKGAFMYERLLRATGFDDVANALKAGQRAPFDTDKFLGQELLVAVENELYNGQVQDKITNFMKA